MLDLKRFEYTDLGKETKVELGFMVLISLVREYNRNHIIKGTMYSAITLVESVKEELLKHEEIKKVKVRIFPETLDVGMFVYSDFNTKIGTIILKREIEAERSVLKLKSITVYGHDFSEIITAKITHSLKSLQNKNIDDVAEILEILDTNLRMPMGNIAQILAADTVYSPNKQNMSNIIEIAKDILKGYDYQENTEFMTYMERLYLFLESVEKAYLRINTLASLSNEVILFDDITSSEIQEDSYAKIIEMQQDYQYFYEESCTDNICRNNNKRAPI